MSAVDLPLSELAHRLARKQSELEEARRAYEARLADLARRREELQAQLRDVDSEIHAVTSTAAADAPAAPAPAPRPPAPGASTAPSASPAPQARGAGAPTLGRFLLDLVRAAGRAITVKELAEEVARRKYPTTSGNIPDLVKNTVSKLVTKGVLRRAEDQPGVVLGQPQSGKPAPAPKAALAGKKTGTNGKAAPKAAPPVKPADKGGRVSLTDVLTRLLAESDRPLKARELADRALAAGYKTESKDFVNVVWVALGKMDLEKVPDQGYRLKKGAPKRK